MPKSSTIKQKRMGATCGAIGRGGGTLVVASLVEACFEELVREHSGLGKAVNAAPNFEVDPAVAGMFEEVVFLYEFVGDVSEFDSDALWAVERGVEVEVADAKGGKLGAENRQDAV